MSVSKITQRHRSFSDSSEDASDDIKSIPVTFELAGETFTAKAQVQGIVLMDFLEESDGGGVSSLVAFKTFLKESMAEEEYTRLNSHLRTSDEYIDITKIAQVVGYLVEEYTSRPTKASAQ